MTIYGMMYVIVSALRGLGIVDFEPTKAFIMWHTISFAPPDAPFGPKDLVLTFSFLYDWLVDQIIKSCQMNGNNTSFIDPSCYLEFFYKVLQKRE